MSDATLQSQPASFLGILRQPNFRNYWLGQLISLIGDNFYMIALPLLALQLSGGSGVALGTVLMFSAFPKAILMLFGGAISDRYSPRSVMMMTNWLNALTIGGLALVLALGSAQLWHLYLVAFLLGTADAFYFPAAGSMMPFIVEARDLEVGNSVYQLSQRLLLLAGPAVAGVIIGMIGISSALGVDVATFVIANLFLASIVMRQRKRQTEIDQTEDEPNASLAKPDGILSSIKAGLVYVVRDPILLGLLLLIAIVDFTAAGAFQVGLPVLIENRFGQGAAALGLVLSSFGTGSLLGVLLGGTLRVQRIGYLFLAISLSLGVTVTLMALVPSVLWLMILLGVMGIGSGVFNVVGISWLQRRTEDAFIGRVMSLVSFSSAGLAPLSLLIAGVLMDISPNLLFTGAGVLVIIGTLILSLRPSFREMQAN
ncbi:MAG: MFS transporter [Anaerolineae bacterium]